MQPAAPRRHRRFLLPVQRSLVVTGLLSAAAALLLLAAPEAHAKDVCDHVNRFEGRATGWNHGEPPLVISDSAMLLSARLVGRLGFDVNARACRQLPDTVQMLRELRRAQALPPLVVLFIGANGQVLDRDLEAARRVIGPRRVLVLLTPLEKGGGAGADADAVRRFAQRHGDQVQLLDWVRHSHGHPDWFYEDGLHPTTFPGAGELSRFVARSRQWYPDPPACGQGAATAVVAAAGRAQVAGTPLCADFTGDGATDMVVPVLSGQPAAMRAWRMYVQRGDTWQLAFADAGELLASAGAQLPYQLSRSGTRRIVVGATLAPECAGCAARPWQFVLEWKRPRFAVVESHPAAA